MSTVKEWWGCWEVRRAWTLALPLTSYATLLNLLPSLGLYFLIHKTGAIVVPTCRVKWVGLCDMTISITSESCFSGKASWRSWALLADSSAQWPEECSWVKAEQPTAQKKVPTVIQIATVQEKVRHHLHALRQMRMLLLNKWSPPPHLLYSPIPQPNHLQGKSFMRSSLSHFYSNQMPGLFLFSSEESEKTSKPIL